MLKQYDLLYRSIYVIVLIQIINAQKKIGLSHSEQKTTSYSFMEKLENSRGIAPLTIERNIDENVYLNHKSVRYDTPDDCQIEKNSQSEHKGVALTCNLRTVNSDFDTTNFSVIPSDNTISLNIICNNDIMAESSLKSRSFAHLSKLRQLTIMNCKIKKFKSNVLDGLQELQNLTIRTNNILWPTLNFEIEDKALDHLKKVIRLDLSSNNIWSLPENLFCTLGSITYLNLSQNQLQDINELGFRDRNHEEAIKSKLEKNETSTNVAANNCVLDLQVLDISFNQFVLLPSNGFGNLRNLRILKLSNNEISMIADKALANLKNLQVLYLNSNKIVSLPAEFFQNLGISLKEVYLSNNSISILSPKIFSYLNQLQTLDLSFNKITSTWIDHNTFIGLIRLVLLDLSHNQITKLEPKIFTDLYTLQILNLQHNQIEIIDVDTFAPMNNLHTLILSYNKLKFLNVGVLGGLFVLSLLSLDNNVLTGVHQEALRNCSSLQELNLNANQLSAIPLAVKTLSLLRTIDLGENNITILQENTFKGLRNLYGLRLIGNYIENITRKTFKDLPNLQILNLSRNRINYIETGSFDVTKNIQAIRLDGNKIRNIENLFDRMTALLWLNISDNEIDRFDYSYLPSSLQWLDIHRNQLSDLSNALSFNNIHLQTLDASFNKITKISSISIPNSIELLFLNDNLIKIIEADTFIHKLNITRVDLYANQIKTLDIKSLRISSINKQYSLPEFYIGSNPFICDCNIEWLQKINQIKTRQYPFIVDLESIYCRLLNSRENIYVALSEAKPKNFLCSYKTHCFTVCHCCEFDACDCKMSCPINCTCFHDQTWTTNIVDCSRANYSRMPRKVPMDASELYIDGNNFIQLFSHTFLGRKNLIVLYVNNSNVHFIYNTTFAGLKRLSELHLEYNKISALKGQEFFDLETLQDLYLQNNLIEYIGNGTFQHLRNLRSLRLDGNRIVHFEVWQLVSNPVLVQISFSNNSWTCECSFLMRFRSFLVKNLKKILDADRISCIYNNMTSILSEDHGAKCTLREDVTIFLYGKEIQNLWPTFMTGVCTLLGCFVLICGIFCYRNELRVWAHKNCVSNVCYRSTAFIDEYDDQAFINDAYLAYSLQDNLFVSQILSQTLETEIGYRLCLHYRDNINVNPCSSESIIESAEKSKQFVIVLSKNFLYNEWSHCDYRTVLNEMIKRRKSLVFILYGDLPQRDIDTDMRNYLRISTCIEWDDKKFWHKLRLALPIKIKNRQSGCINRSSKKFCKTSISCKGKQTEKHHKYFDDFDNYSRTSNCRHNYATIPIAAPNCRLKSLNELSGKDCEQELKSYRTNTLDKNYKHENSTAIYMTANSYKDSNFGYDHFKHFNQNSAKISNVCNCRDPFEPGNNYVPKNCSFIFQKSFPGQMIGYKTHQGVGSHGSEDSFYRESHNESKPDTSYSSNNSRSD